MKTHHKLMMKGMSGGVSGKAPIQVTGLTGWWDAGDATTLYTDAGTTPVSADADVVYRMTDKSGGAGSRYFEQATLGNRALYKVNRQNGRSGLLFDGTDDFMTSAAFSNFIAADNAYYFIVFKLKAAASANAALVCDVGYQEILYSSNGHNYRNRDSTGQQTTDEITEATDEAVLLTCWHTGGNIYIQKNGGTVSSPVASGNTDALIFALQICRDILPMNFDFYEMAIYNLAVSDSDRTALNNQFKNKWGIA